MKNSNDTIGNRTRDLLAYSAVLQPTASPRARTMQTLYVIERSIAGRTVTIRDQNTLNGSTSLTNSDIGMTSQPLNMAYRLISLYVVPHSPPLSGRDETISLL